MQVENFLKLNASSKEPSMTLRCYERLATALGLKTTLDIFPGEQLEVRHTRS